MSSFTDELDKRLHEQADDVLHERFYSQALVQLHNLHWHRHDPQTTYSLQDRLVEQVEEDIHAQL